MFKKLMDAQNEHMEKTKQKATEKQETFNASPKGQALLKKQEEVTKKLIEDCILVLLFYSPQQNNLSIIS